LLCVLVAAIVTVSLPAFDIGGERLTEFEMRMKTGKLFILDLDALRVPVEFDYSQKSDNPELEHCDIIAQNQADDMGLDTRDQSGSFRDYNDILVEEIYEGYPRNRSSEPKEGTSGYYFTSNGGKKEHMGTYSRKTGSKTYTRNMNRSFRGTEKSAKVSVDYKPPGVVSQVFVSLPKLPFFKRYHR